MGAIIIMIGVLFMAVMVAGDLAVAERDGTSSYATQLLEKLKEHVQSYWLVLSNVGKSRRALRCALKMIPEPEWEKVREQLLELFNELAPSAKLELERLTKYSEVNPDGEPLPEKRHLYGQYREIKGAWDRFERFTRDLEAKLDFARCGTNERRRFVTELNKICADLRDRDPKLVAMGELDSVLPAVDREPPKRRVVSNDHN